jgi:transposase
MSDEGLIASMSFPGSLNTDSFLVFIEQILLPQLWVGAIVTMDNLPVHYATIATNLIESVGAKVKFLPPYSPDLSPIELCWSKLKEIIRSAKARIIEALDEAKWVGKINYRPNKPESLAVQGVPCVNNLAEVLITNAINAIK